MLASSSAILFSGGNDQLPVSPSGVVVSGSLVAEEKGEVVVPVCQIRPSRVFPEVLREPRPDASEERNLLPPSLCTAV